jgi:hypothetical protein
MTHLVSRQLWGDVDVDMTLGRIFVQQKWHYTWTVFSSHVSPWTYPERKLYHNTLDRQIWAEWSNRFRLQVSGAGDFARRFHNTGVPLNFDIRWVTTPGHWQVTVRKMPPNSNRTTFRSHVVPATRRIELDTMDIVVGSAANDAGRVSHRFRSGPHEFGHTMAVPDEYNAGSTHLADTKSIMNIGTEVRRRHLKLTIDALNALMPNVTFAAPRGMA